MIKKPRTRIGRDGREYVVRTVILDSGDYQEVVEEARFRRMQVSALFRNIIVNWIRGGKR